jgi:hypothetical protein
MRVHGSSPLLRYHVGDGCPLSDHGSLRGRRMPPHDGVGSVGLVMSTTRSIGPMRPGPQQCPRDGRWCTPDGQRHDRLPSTSYFWAPDAAQAQRRSPPPHPKDVFQGAELVGLRSGTAPAWQPRRADRDGAAPHPTDPGCSCQATPGTGPSAFPVQRGEVNRHDPFDKGWNFRSARRACSVRAGIGKRSPGKQAAQALPATR